MTATARTLKIETQNGQTLTLVVDGNVVTVRIAKDGHNRGIAKVTASDGQSVARFLEGSDK